LALDLQGNAAVTHMMHKTTLKTAVLVGELCALAGEINAGLISTASREARREWRLLRRQWPSSQELEAGRMGLSEGELVVMVGKVRRFKAILETLRPAVLPNVVPALAPLAAA
jgi:hypothetical protein